MTSLVEFVGTFILSTVVLILLRFGIPLVYSIWTRDHKAQTKLVEEKWKRDTVYLFQMPGTSTLPSVSPFCIKVETFLRLHQISYERRYTILGRGANGKVPYVEFNGEHFSDSQIILRRLAFHFKTKEYETTQDALYGHAISRMADNHTYNLFIHYKVLHNPGNLFRGMLGGMIPDWMMDIVAPVIAIFVSAEIHKRLHATTGSFSDEEYRELTRKDLTTYQDLIGEKKFLFGDKLSTADCSVFGHLAAMLYLDQHCHPVYLLKSHQFVPLREYVERVRSDVFAGKFCM